MVNFDKANNIGGGNCMRYRSLVGAIICLLILSSASVSFSEEIISNFVDKILPFENLEVVGYFKNETAWGFGDENDQLHKLKNIMDIKANYEFSDWFNVFVNLRTFYDSLYDIEGNYRETSKDEIL